MNVVVVSTRYPGDLSRTEELRSLKSRLSGTEEHRAMTQEIPDFGVQVYQYTHTPVHTVIIHASLIPRGPGSMIQTMLTTSILQKYPRTFCNLH